MAERFYVNCPLAPGPVHLEGSEAHHLAVVCRLRPGSAIVLFNGDGLDYPASIISVAKKQVRVDVLNAEARSWERTHALIVAAPLPKGDRGQFLVEKLTELGVRVFVPLRTERSVVHPGKSDRLERYVIEASKQCGRNVLMAVEPVQSWRDFCARIDLPVSRHLAHPGGGDPRLRAEPCVVAVGPEGGLTDEELTWALQCGWNTVGLGPRILRIETAALALAARVPETEVPPTGLTE